VSKRSLGAGGVELKLRRSTDRSILPQDEVVSRVQAIIGELNDEIAAEVRAMPF
jgi:hypothetical protein